MESKNLLRQRHRAALAAMSPGARGLASADACARLCARDLYVDARCVFVFLSMAHEIDTTLLVERAWQDGKRVLVPRVDAGLPAMHAVAITSWDDAAPGHFGIREPTAGDAEPIGRIDLCVIPGLAFDREGRRLGQGGGYYDRFLAQAKCRAKRCGIGFESQVVDELPAEPHDQRLELLVTEARMLCF